MLFTIAALSGALGALAQELKTNVLTMPHVRQRRVYLGSLGRICLGAIAGGFVPVVTTSAVPMPLSALVAGYLGNRWWIWLTDRNSPMLPTIPCDNGPDLLSSPSDTGTQQS